MSSLYLQHFGLATPPFSITPDPGFFFEGEDRGIFIAGLLHAVQQCEGIILLTGEVGSGKTLMSRILLSRLPGHIDTVYLPNPAFSSNEIIDVIARDLGITALSPGMRLEALQHELIKRYEAGRQVLVFIDEAHTMTIAAIEEVRRLSNLETDHCKLVQLVLCGQPELDTLLASPQLRQVRDRVVYRLVLNKLSIDEARGYLNHRLSIAGWRGGQLFSTPGERLLLKEANGRARRINLIADKALLAAFSENKKQVGARHVQLAILDAGANFSSAFMQKKHWQTAAALLFLLSSLTLLWLSSKIW